MYEQKSCSLANWFAWAKVVPQENKPMRNSKYAWKNKDASYKILVSKIVLSASQPYAYGK